MCIRDSPAAADAQQSRIGRLRTAFSVKAGRAVLQSPGSKSTACIAGMHRGDQQLLSCKSQNAVFPRDAPALGKGGRGGEGPTRLHSAPGDLCSFLDAAGHASSPATVEELDLSACAQHSGHPPELSSVAGVHAHRFACEFSCMLNMFRFHAMSARCWLMVSCHECVLGICRRWRGHIFQPGDTFEDVTRTP